MAMGTGQGGPEINVTPLIDVLLVLLIIFLLIQTNMKPKGEEALIPQPPPEGRNVPQPERTIVIRLLPALDGSRPELRVNGEEVTWADLHDRLFAIYAPRVERVAFIQADKDVDFEYVAEVIDAAHGVEVDKVGLMLPEAVDAAVR